VSNLLLAQTEDTLYAFDLPKELQRKPGQFLTPIQRKAEAALRIDGEEQRFEPSPIMIDNRMFVPLRALFEAVGAAVEYDEATSGVNVAYADRAFTLREGAPFALVGGKQQALSYAPLLMNAAVYVPLRDVGGLLGVEVVWNDDTRTVEITTAPTNSM
ncbi:copper amine oxidase N-terminal domain-containing protein, partial [Paenibacillus sp.]|uniref:copper amine oxidase N-terminal domain-containing protein n=1 Tax=Paenibacillus sp. TaxID=58172 RepID=UPI002810B9BA